MSRAPIEEAMPPGASGPIRRLALSVARPVERFLHIEAASGVILMLMAAIAIAWANSPWASTYEHLLHTPISITPLAHEKSAGCRYAGPQPPLH